LGLTLLLVLVVVPGLIFAVWTAVTLGYSYSSGERVGYNQKFSRKGWLCKTWEGELAISNVPGQVPQLFRYSVREDAVARQIQAAEGQRVSISYEQHVGVPTSCFGETEYFATGVRVLNDPYAPMMRVPTGAPAAAPPLPATPPTPVAPAAPAPPPAGAASAPGPTPAPAPAPTPAARP
jgi:hypothetical protein